MGETRYLTALAVMKLRKETGKETSQPGISAFIALLSLGTKHTHAIAYLTSYPTPEVIYLLFHSGSASAESTSPWLGGAE